MACAAWRCGGGGEQALPLTCDQERAFADAAVQWLLALARCDGGGWNGTGGMGWLRKTGCKGQRYGTMPTAGSAMEETGQRTSKTFEANADDGSLSTDWRVLNSARSSLQHGTDAQRTVECLFRGRQENDSKSRSLWPEEAPAVRPFVLSVRSWQCPLCSAHSTCIDGWNRRRRADTLPDADSGTRLFLCSQLR